MIANTVDGRGINKDWMSLDEMSPEMARAAIAAEDGNFCKHNGFDFKAIQKAMESNFKGVRKIRGGSTISQQTAKNAFLWQNGGYFRKALEAWFTVLIETLWTKKRILTRAEAARIAAVLPLPKKREAISPTGFTRRYGNMISRRIGQVRRYGQDDCLE
jgi:monofunctional biosynthetic peptidoglycan transglycosylase